MPQPQTQVDTKELRRRAGHTAISVHTTALMHDAADCIDEPDSALSLPSDAKGRG